MTCTTDNGTNVVKAIKLLEFLHKLCVGHTLICQYRVSRALARVRKLVGHFHISTKVMSKLHEKHRLLGIECHQLIHDCVTRWSSTYDRFVKLFVLHYERVVFVMIDI